MKFLHLFVVLLLSFALSNSKNQKKSTLPPHSFEADFSWKRVNLSLLSNGKATKFSVVMGLHASGFVFHLESKLLAKDSTGFFKNVAYLKPIKKKKGQLLAFIDYRLVDSCEFTIEQGGLFSKDNIFFSAQNREGAKEGVWNVGIAPNLKGVRLCGGSSLPTFISRLAQKCRTRQNSLKHCVRNFISAGSEYFRANTEMIHLKSKLEDLHKFATEAKNNVNTLVSNKTKAEKVLNSLRKSVSKAAANYLKTKKSTQFALADTANKSGLEAQIHKEINTARSRYEVASRNLNYVKKKLLELIPDAEDQVNQAFLSAEKGRHRQELLKIKIKS